ncbi:MAG: GNAT family N-acetyltransferase [Alicyclobacillus herbarius]|nr:GNAT family N-acetyltransferase [Alicyclobacillus herbarius]
MKKSGSLRVAIYLLQDYQRQGIGRRLFRHVIQHLVQNECLGMLIWVLADNPSRRFYESLRGQPIRES